MDYVYVIAAVIASVYLVTYGLWIKKNGNRAGAIFVFCLALLCIGLPIFKIVMNP